MVLDKETKQQSLQHLGELRQVWPNLTKKLAESKMKCSIPTPFGRGAIKKIATTLETEQSNTNQMQGKNNTLMEEYCNTYNLEQQQHKSLQERRKISNAKYRDNLQARQLDGVRRLNEKLNNSELEAQLKELEK
jgi:hypothetical protein